MSTPIVSTIDGNSTDLTFSLFSFVISLLVKNPAVIVPLFNV